MHLEIPLPSKLTDIPLESITSPADLQWGVIPQSDHEMAEEMHTQNAGLATRFLPFLLWDAVASTVLILPNNVTRQHIHHFVPLPSAIFQATSPLHLPTTFYILEQRNLPGAIPQNGNFSPLREFWKGWNKWQSKGGGWVRAADESEQPGCNCFFLVTTEKHCLKIMGLLLTNSGLFPSGGAFHWSDGERHLLEVTAWFSAKELLPQDSLMIPPYTQHRLLWKQTTLWSGWW